MKQLQLLVVQPYIAGNWLHNPIAHPHHRAAGFPDIPIDSVSYGSQNGGALTGLFPYLRRINRLIKHIRLNLLPCHAPSRTAGSDQLLTAYMHLAVNFQAFFQIIQYPLHHRPDQMSLLMMHAKSEKYASRVRVVIGCPFSRQIRTKKKAFRAGRDLSRLPVQLAERFRVPKHAVSQPA